MKAVIEFSIWNDTGFTSQLPLTSELLDYLQDYSFNVLSSHYGTILYNIVNSDEDHFKKCFYTCPLIFKPSFPLLSGL